MSLITWYTSWIRGRSGPVVPSFHPARKSVQQSMANWTLAVHDSGIDIVSEDGPLGPVEILIDLMLSVRPSSASSMFA